MSGIFARKIMPDAKRGLTISISWDIKKENVLRRETVCPPKGRREGYNITDTLDQVSPWPVCWRCATMEQTS